jgi:protein TonB
MPLPRLTMPVLYGASILLHASLGLGVSRVEPKPEPERIAVRMVEVKKPPPKSAEEPPPPPVTPEAPKKAEAKKSEPKAPPKAEAPRPSAAPVPSFGVAMTGGVGLGGVAVPMGDVHGEREPAPKRVREERALSGEPAKPKVAQACAEPVQKARPVDLARPEYTEEARAAGVEGKVRLELTVDVRGTVKHVNVLESLGHGLDQAAVRSVQNARFEPALACGTPVETTFVVSIRFAL